MNYTQTDEYRCALSFINSDIKQHNRELLRLQQLSTRTKTKQDKIHKKLATRYNDLNVLNTPTKWSWETAIRMLMNVEGTFWTLDEGDLNDKPRIAGEGFGEKGLRKRLGMPTVITNTKSMCDLEEHGEVKCMQNMNIENFSITPIKLGTVGETSYRRWLGLAQKELNLSDEQIGTLARGEVSFNGNEDYEENMKLKFSPSAILRDECEYNAIWNTFLFGFIRIEQGDYDKAYKLVKISQGGPRYTLDKNYIINRVLSHGLPQQTPDSSPVDIFG